MWIPHITKFFATSPLLLSISLLILETLLTIWVLAQFFLFSWNQFSDGKGWKVNCSKHPKVNIQNWHASLLNILSSTRRNCIKQVTRRVKTKCGFSQHIKQDTHHMVKNCRGGRDAEIDRRNKPYTDAMESLLKDEYADSSHYAATRNMETILRISFQQMPLGACRVWPWFNKTKNKDGGQQSRQQLAK